MQNLIINEELKNLLPPLSAAEYAGLEKSILAEGCLSPLSIWSKTIIDGHARYEICRKHDIPFQVKSIRFKDIDEAKLWIGKNQSNRRNLTTYQRAVLALKLKGIIAERAKARQRRDHQEEGEPIRVGDELGKIAGTSHDTISRVEYILKHGDKKTLERLGKGVPGTSINREFCRLREKIDGKPVRPKIVQKPNSGKTVDMVALCEGNEPETLADSLVANITVEYVNDFLFETVREYRKWYGKAATQGLLIKTFALVTD